MIYTSTWFFLDVFVLVFSLVDFAFFIGVFILFQGCEVSILLYRRQGLRFRFDRECHAGHLFIMKLGDMFAHGIFCE